VDRLSVLKPSFKGAKSHSFLFTKVYRTRNNDLALQLKKSGIRKVVLADIYATLCTESQIRDLRK
jgi:nicotinamidase-related amidase